MKHVIITLPFNLWQAICNGSKLFECRKVIPRIRPFSGRVYVIIKGTDFVAGYFTLSGIIGTDDAEYIWEYCYGNLAVSKEWFMNYAATKRKLIYAWEIDCVYQFSDKFDKTEYFAINRNPQSIMYTNLEPYIPGCLVRGTKHTIPFLRRNDVMPISLYYHESWYDNIPEKINDESEPEKAVQ